MLRERAGEAAGNGERRQSLRLCLGDRYRSRTEARPGRVSALRSEAAVWHEVHVKRQLIRRTGPSGRNMLRHPPLPSNVVKRRLW